MSKPALQWIPGFMQAARTGNMTRAAEQLNVTVSALSHQMRRLEERMGKRLMSRGPRGIELTPDGQDLYQRLEPHYQAIEQLLQPHTYSRGDVLTITALASMTNAWLIPRLGDFVQQYPDVQLNLDSSIRLVDFEKERHLDAALRFGVGQWPNLHSHFLFKEWISPAASPALIKQMGKPTLKDLHRYPLIDDPFGRWKRWFQHFSLPQPKRYVARFNEAESAHRAAAEGVGIVLARHVLAAPLIKAKRLSFIGKEKMQADFSYYLVYPERSKNHRGLLHFKDWLKTQLPNNKALD
jgi:LysR family transcriptional regulator, glycine cleavage system transcriptional activator